MTGPGDHATEDVDMNSHDEQTDPFNHGRLYADSFQPPLSLVGHTGYVTQCQLPTPASSPAPHERFFNRSRSSSRRSSYSRRTSSAAARSPTTVSSLRSRSSASQSASVSNQAKNEDSLNKISTTAQVATRGESFVAISPRMAY